MRRVRERFLGEQHVKVSPGKWRSVDGRRQFRLKPGDFRGRGPLGSHAHLEFLRRTPSGHLEVVKNVHVPIR